MEYSKLRSKGRLVAAICVLGLSTTLLAQTSSSSVDAPTPDTQTAAAKQAKGVNPSRADIFLGYSYLSPHGWVNGSRYKDVNLGAIGSGAYYFNKYFGGEITVASHPDGPGDGFTSFSLGPIFRFPGDKATPFIHASVGGVKMGGPNYDGFYLVQPPPEEPVEEDSAKSLLAPHQALQPISVPIHMVNPYRWGTVLTAGGGMDYQLFRHLAWRVFQADYQYMHTSFGPASAYPPDGTTNIIGGRANVNAIQLSTGLVFKLGSIIPPPPVAYTCSASPAEVYPGDPVAVTGNAQNLDPKKTANYTWTSTSGAVSGTSSTGNIDTASLNPGSYTVTGHVSEGTKPGQSADCKTTFTVKPYEPPTVSCSANPTTVNPGDSSTITSQGVSPQNRPLTYSYSASSGAISGSDTTATLNTTGAAPGVITVTCNVADDKGQTASSTTSVTINAPAPPPAPKVETLCSINFGRDKRRPTRVDNEAKACLDDVALNLQRNADAKAVLVGNSAASERRGATAAAERAVNTKAYLVKEKGIDPSRIDVRTGNAGTESVQNYLVPSGATFDNDVQGTTEVDTSRVKVSRNPYGRSRSRR